MGTTFQKCGPEVVLMLEGLISEYRNDLAEVDARITLLFAFSDKPGKPAISHHGHVVAGRAQVNSLQDRAEGKGDATITLDGDTWDGRSGRRKLALLHHELSHIGSPRATATIKVDALGRPKLRLVPGDFENDGFYRIIQIYGDDAPEKRWLDSVGRQIAEGQPSLPFDAKGPDPDAARAASKAEIDAAFASDADDDQSTVTLSAGGRSVTVKGRDFDRINKSIRAGLKS